MGVVVTIMNMKGGVGKTTVAMHLAGRAGAMPLGGKIHKVLAIDYDPQFNLSQGFIPAAKYFPLEAARKTSLSILVDDDAALDPFELQVSGNHSPPALEELVYNFATYSEGKGKLDIIPSTLDLMYVALGHVDKKTRPMEERFEKTIEAARKIYDLVIIDCHPAGSLLTKTSLRNSDHVVIPVVPQSSYAVRGIGLMMQFISSKAAGHGKPTPHILFNKTPRFSASHDEGNIRSNKNFAPFCLKNTLHHYKAFSEPEGGKGFVWSSSKAYSTEAYTNLTDVTSELLDRIGM